MRYTQSLTRNRDFRGLYARGKTAAGAYLAVYTRKNRLGVNRLGLTVSTKLGGAVIRNRIRRRMREAYRLQEEKLPAGYDIVFVARARALKAPFDGIQKEMVFLLHKLGIAAVPRS